MKISERCKKNIEDIENAKNKLKSQGRTEPYSVVMWDRDFESITELYIAYKLLVDENDEMKKQVKELTYTLNKNNKALESYKYALNLQSETIKSRDEEIKKLYNKERELHTIKKSFEVLRALYLGDYEYDDEPF